MRYIQKKDIIPVCLSEYLAECDALGVPHPLLYKDFNRTSELRRELSLEQHNVCCYCQRAVEGRTRIEHLYPENGTDKQKSESLQLDYYNLFASCIDSMGKTPELQCCDVAKGNALIREFIKERDCTRYFRYTINGEIIPNGSFHTWDDYEGADQLPQDVKDAKDCIKTLNLNCSTLVEDRKRCIDTLILFLKSHEEKEVQLKVNQWLQSSTYPSYIELRLQYIRTKYPQIAI